MSSLILIPGLACDAEIFDDLRAALPARPAGLAVHTTDVGQRADSLPEMARLLLAECPGPLVLAGHSMGAMVAMHAALQAPERVRALALLATTAQADPPEMVALRTEACARFAAGEIDAVLQANVPFAFHPANVGDEALVQRYMAIVQRAGAARLIRQNQAVMIRPDLRPRLRAIGCPVLVVCGVGDGLTPPEHSHEIVAALPRAEAAVLPWCGHMLTLEQPAVVARLLGDWLARLPRPA